MHMKMMIVPLVPLLPFVPWHQQDLAAQEDHLDLVHQVDWEGLGVPAGRVVLCTEMETRLCGYLLPRISRLPTRPIVSRRTWWPHITFWSLGTTVSSLSICSLGSFGTIFPGRSSETRNTIESWESRFTFRPRRSLEQSLGAH